MQVNFTAFSRLGVSAGGLIRGWVYIRVSLFTALNICSISWKKNMAGNGFCPQYLNSRELRL